MALVYGVLLGGLFQILCQIPLLLKHGFEFRPVIWSHPLFKKIGKLLIPRALGSAIYQINVFVNSILASFDGVVGAGGLSALYYANRLFQLPLAIFAISLAQAALPTFSMQIIREDREGFKKTLSVTIRSTLFIAIPASVGLALLADSMIRVLFERGHFDEYSSRITSSALYFYSFGLVACCLIKLLVNAFYAMHDTKTPVKTMLTAVGFDILFSLLFMRSLKIGGLALASSLSATLNMMFLYRALRKKIGPLDEKKILKEFLKIIAASAGMGLVILFFDHFFIRPSLGSPILKQGLYLFGSIILGILVYMGLARVLKVEGPRKLFA